MNLRTTAEQILELTGRVPLHSDPKVEQQILIQDILDLIEDSEDIRSLRREALYLDSQVRRLQDHIDDLEAE